MPVLSNARHELFAQELAGGNSATEAYRLAGYRVDDKSAAECASRLSRNINVSARIAEIKERGARRAEITVESLIAECEEARKLAMSIEQPSAAIAAVREKGVLSGKRIEKSEHGEPGDFDDLSDEELAEFIQQEADDIHIADGTTQL
jgi:phage terminase small subunit